MVCADLDNPPVSLRSTAPPKGERVSLPLTREVARASVTEGETKFVQSRTTPPSPSVTPPLTRGGTIPQSPAATALAAARSLRGSDRPPDGHSLPLRPRQRGPGCVARGLCAWRKPSQSALRAASSPRGRACIPPSACGRHPPLGKGGEEASFTQGGLGAWQGGSLTERSVGCFVFPTASR